MATTSGSALRSAIITVAVFLGTPLTLSMTDNTQAPGLSIALAEPAQEPVFFDLALDEPEDAVDEVDESGSPEADEEDTGPGEDSEAGPDSGPDVPQLLATDHGTPIHTPRPEARERTRPVGKKKRRRCEDPDPRIEQATDTQWAVERSLVDEVTRSIKAINKLGYAQRHRTDEGSVDGFRVGGIKCGSPLYAGGLRNGDVIHSVNGQRVTTWPKAILLYRKLRKQEAFTVRVTRKGRPLSLHYQVV